MLFDRNEVFSVGGKSPQADHGTYYHVVEVLPDGWAIAEHEINRVRVFVQVTGRKAQWMGSWNVWRVRVRFYAAEDTGKQHFDKLSETLPPNKNEAWGGWMYM